VGAARQTGFKSKPADSGLLHTKTTDSPMGKPATNASSRAHPRLNVLGFRSLDFLGRFEQIASLALFELLQNA